MTQDNDPIPVPDAETIVYVMCVADLGKTVARLLEKRKPGTPCALIENGTTSQERVITGTLETILAKAQGARLRPPAIFVVGPTVSLREKILAVGGIK